MTQPMANGRRRIDRVLAEDFLDGLGERSLDEVRALRHDAEQEEADLSYVRRLLQGRMDLVRAEQTRRGEEGSAPLIDLLAQVLADGPRSDHGSGRFLTVEPSRVDDHRRKVEQIVSDVGISDVAARSDAELQTSLDALAEHERMVSELRRRVQTVMDALTAEITRRYRDGEADVAALLSPGS
ncbi:MAG TPA: aerial mycelium formation protein [Candidatus Limnocylindria bacterium]|nr:aerial mycelium formation protein [Candidatus Limnocylindria bacterium]